MYTSKIFLFIAGVVDTADKHSFMIISFQKIGNGPNVILGAGGHRFMKKLKSKISCQTPLNGIKISWY